MKPHEFTMPEVGCTPRELHEAIAVCSMQLARVTTLVAEYKNKLAAAEAKYKKEFAMALILNRGAGNQTIVKALAETTEPVVVANNVVIEIEAIYTLLRAEYEAWETYFVALRKLAALLQSEVQRFE